MNCFKTVEYNKKREGYGMANQEHLNVLKQGVEIWNQWRVGHRDIRPNLTYANLRNADLRNADLRDTHLGGADLSGANLDSADLSSAILILANLGSANLTNAILIEANFTDANFSNVIFTQAFLWNTVLGNVDLSTVKGLEEARHQGGSSLDIRTIYRSQGKIPEVFLRGTGAPDIFITYAHSLIGHPIEYYTCFISYSSKDQSFAERLYADLQNHNVRCWYAPEDLKIGDKFRNRIDESIRVYDKLLIVLSEASLASSWVSYEVGKALDKEPEGKPNVLFPIRLDKAILTCETDWVKDIRKSRHIGDFEHWKDHDVYQIAFERLLRDLKAQS